jgi:RNA polymerase sigma factor for flagellar operon FliA
MKKKASSRPPPRLDLLNQYAPLVRKIVGGFLRKLPRNVQRDDLLAAGMCGLWDAIRRNPDGAGESFEWYLRVRIRGAIIDELRAQDWLPRRARAAAEATSGTDAYVPPPAVVRFDDLSAWEQERALYEASSTEAVLAHKQLLDHVLKEIDKLPPRDRHVMIERYSKARKLEEIAKEMGVTVPRISQIHARAVGHLRSELTGAPAWKRKGK